MPPAFFEYFKEKSKLPRPTGKKRVKGEMGGFA